jgi:hypothetical protein
MKKYIKSFIIGSSWPIFIFYFIPVSQYGKMMNLPFTTYTMIAPPFLGLLNVYGMYLKNRYTLSQSQRFFYTGLIGAIFISITITLLQIYNFTTKSRWIRQYINLQIMYFFIFSIVIRSLEDALENC